MKMSNSTFEEGQNNESTSGGRFLVEVVSTEPDIEKAKTIPPGGCPRRYCWWWVSLSFEWQLTPPEGCTLLSAKKPANFRYADVACCRSDPSSPIDHFEPREPHLERDNMDPALWLRFREEKNAGK
jgi:hypothetical protein